MWIVFLAFCFTYAYHLNYMCVGKVHSDADLFYRVFMVIVCAAVAFTIGCIIPNDKFWWWNPY